VPRQTPPRRWRDVALSERAAILAVSALIVTADKVTDGISSIRRRLTRKEPPK